MRVQVIDQLAALAPGYAGAGDRDGGDALGDLEGKEVGASLSRQFEAKAALEIGVSGAGLDQQVRQPGRAEVDEAGCGKPGRDPRLSRHEVLFAGSETPSGVYSTLLLTPIEVRRRRRRLRRVEDAARRPKVG
ncbi:hypothetical protein D3C87_1454530 [compost metagenome]